MSIHHGIRESSYISSVSGLSPALVNQYIELIGQCSNDSQKKAMMEDMVRQWKRAGTRIKKKEDTSEGYMRHLVPMIGGVR